jgi:hypothetical protein
MRLNLDEIECRSVFEGAAETTFREVAGPSDAGGGGAAVRGVDVEDLLYLPSVLDTGQSLCLIDERSVPLEAVLDEWTVEFVKEKWAGRRDDERTYADPFEVDEVRDRVCVLGNVFSRHFGHWTEELLKVALLEHAGDDCTYAFASLPRFAAESLSLLGVDADRILSIEHPTRFERAVFTTAISHDQVSNYPQALTTLRALVDRQLPPGASAYGSRLWLDRGEMLRNGGVVLNRDEVYGCIERHDFEVVDMATLSVSEQLRAVRHADVIAGPHGSQFVHAQFMPPRSTVIECFSPTHVNPSVLQICRVLGHSYHQIVARTHLLFPYGHGRDCVVDCDHLELVLESL